jgi:Iron-containing redox enzyme
VLPALLDAGPRLIEHPRVAELYPEFLFSSHCIIRASVPLMETGRERAEALPEGDAVAAALAGYLEEHITEEMHHDEWLLDDLEVIGSARADVLARPPAPSVAALVGAQYYWIFHYHPVALLGYIAVLEGYPPSPRLIEDLQSRTGYDASAFRTLRTHGELDPGHAEELDELLDSLPLTREQSAVVGLSAIHTVGALARVYEEIVS